MKVFGRSIWVLLLAIGLVGCQKTELVRMKVSALDRPGQVTPLEQGDAKRTFALSKLLSDIDRGERILAFPAGYDGTYCNMYDGGENVVTYSGSKQFLGDWSSELGEVFYEALTNKGFSVAGDPTDLFTQATVARSSEYLIGGRITHIAGNFCHLHHWWDGRPLNKYSGELEIEVEWSVFNTLTKQVIAKFKSSGVGRQNEKVKDGVYLAFESAFIEAVEGFAQNDTVRKLATGERITSGGQAVALDQTAVKNGTVRESFSTDYLQSMVMTIRVGQGHGSGFFIGNEGLLLTNAHVVGSANSVQVVSSNGLEIEGKVIARDTGRDIAIVKSPLKPSSVMHINTSDLAVAQEVYAIGTPMDEGLKSTITKGIISGFRNDPASGLRFIQADVAISPGNSGGPLVDSLGSVVGVSVAKYQGGGAEGLGLFIPIQNALEALQIKLQ